jgi:sulfide:quinone oxidoreductase
MAHIVILGAGIGGMPAAYEMREKLRPGDTLTVISNNPKHHFTPSNPWVAVDWRKRGEIEVEIAPLLAKKNIAFIPVGAKRVHPDKNQIELDDGRNVDYDFLVIATGPKLAFEEVEGLGPQGHTHSICHVDHAVEAELPGRNSSRRPGRWWSARCRWPPATARPTSSP